MARRRIEPDEDRLKYVIWINMAGGISNEGAARMMGLSTATYRRHKEQYRKLIIGQYRLKLGLEKGHVMKKLDELVVLKKCKLMNTDVQVFGGNDEVWMTREQIGCALGYADPKKAI